MAYSNEYLSILQDVNLVVDDDCSFLDDEFIEVIDHRSESRVSLRSEEIGSDRNDADSSKSEDDSLPYTLNSDGENDLSSESAEDEILSMEYKTCDTQTISSTESKYPIDSINMILIVSAALTVLVIEKNISLSAFNSIISMLRATGFIHQGRLTWRSINRLIRKKLFIGDSPQYVLEVDAIKQVAAFDLLHQIRLIMIEHYDTIESYRSTLSAGNGDILSSSNDLDYRDPLILHLHFSADGGQLFRYKKLTLWAMHATLLDLPLRLRTKKENIILFYLWAGKHKPDWSSFLRDYLNNSIIGKTSVILLNGVPLKIKVILYSAVFDLPAMASILNIVQYNGKFGCPFCCAPGFVKRVGRGHSRKYAGIRDLVSDERFYEFCSLAEESNTSIFGVKGHSCLSDFLPLPSRLLLDPLHLLYENCGKMLFMKLIDSSSYRNDYYLGRHIDHYDSIKKRVFIPHFLELPKSLKEMSFWKARDLMNFLFFFSFPTLYSSLFKKSQLNQEYSFHFLTFIVATRFCYSSSARSCSENVKILFTYFHSRLPLLYDSDMCSINMHLLLHLSDQVKHFGSLSHCSMFAFEHQFFVFKLITQGTRFHLKQICDKVSLLKHSKCFLNVSEFEKKEDVVNILNVARSVVTKEVFVDEGLVIFGKRRYFSNAYKRKPNISTVYEIPPMHGCNFVEVVKFKSTDVNIIAKVNLLTVCQIPMLDFDSMSLPDVPRQVKDIMNQQIFYHFVHNAGVCEEIPFLKLMNPCVVVQNVDPDSSVMLVMPCTAVPEYN